MAVRKSVSRRSVTPGFVFQQPFIGFAAKVGARALGDKKSLKLYPVSDDGTCREEALYSAQVQLKQGTFSTKRIRGSASWEREETQTHTLDLDTPETKQPGLTYFFLNSHDDDYDRDTMCQRPCCQGTLVEVMDALVGNVGVLLDPDWYQGNWWETTLEDNLKKKDRYGGKPFHYYGISNFFLRHPALLHAMLGLFRQTYLIHCQNFDGPLRASLNRNDVVKALSQGDPELALHNLEKIRPWLELNVKPIHLYPFPKGYWYRLIQLHKAIYKHGYEEVFGGSIEQGWDLHSKGYGRNVNGAWSYWGSLSKGKTKRKLNSASKRLATLSR